MSSPEMRNVPSLSPMPSPGAVWPAMVILELVTRRFDEGTWMYPLTAKTMVRPDAGAVAMASANEPVPLELRLVTE